MVDDLDDLYAIIAGKGRFAILGGYLHTYPLMNDVDHIKLHNGCLELERRGRIVRHIDEPDHVCWKAHRRTRSCLHDL
jgi:hypothetical protein